MNDTMPADSKTSVPPDVPLKLHLGCGEVFLPGYVNIDLPLADHTVQSANRATIRADLTTLHYPAGSIDEIRLHHVFEHFDRPTALFLLIVWHRWLRAGGRLIVEVPDFARCARRYVLAVSTRSRLKLLRHLFGSHEASWAIHCDGWDRARFEAVLPRVGFEHMRFRRSGWRGTYNLTVTASKAAARRDHEDPIALARRILEQSLVDRSPSELRLLEVWSDRIRELLERAGA